MNQKLPQHVAIVMDGNGRWAESQGLPRVDGHRAGMEAVKVAVQACLENNIRILSLFAFSCENWSRPSEEVSFLMELFIQAIKQEIASLHEHGVRLQFIGDRSRLSKALCNQMAEAEQFTLDNTQLTINIAVNYSGRWDIIQATQAVAARVLEGTLALSAIDESLFSTMLSTHAIPDPDLLIRTSGEQRISNFFLWQFAYTELYFTRMKWPEFTRNEFENALRDFTHRERRYGLTSTQLTGNDDV